MKVMLDKLYWIKPINDLMMLLYKLPFQPTLFYQIWKNGIKNYKKIIVKNSNALFLRKGRFLKSSKFLMRPL